jgi:hypothetical protein
VAIDINGGHLGIWRERRVSNESGLLFVFESLNKDRASLVLIHAHSHPLVLIINIRYFCLINLMVNL